jgi:prepilin-type N-terminal cleavage/methylation domain-containing protein
MPHLTRRGFTLVELLIGLILIGIVSAGIYRVLVNNQRIYSAQTQRIEMLQNIRAAAAVLPAEFRELSASEGDISAMSATSISIRGMRQLAFLCATPVLGNATVMLTVRRTPIYGVRDFDAGRDSLFVYYEGDDATRNDDGWLIGRINAAPSVGVCPDGAPATLIIASLVFDGGLVPPQTPVTGNIRAGSPVRGFEPVTYSLYTAGDGRRYIGLQEGAATIQPLIGPLTANGLTLAYFDSTGAGTGTPARVAMIQMTLRAETRQALRQLDGSLGPSVDSVTTWVALRNNLRY